MVQGSESWDSAGRGGHVGNSKGKSSRKCCLAGSGFCAGIYSQDLKFRMILQFLYYQNSKSLGLQAYII